MSTSTENGAAGENLETQGRRLFVGLERRIYSTLEFPQEMEPKEHSQESRLCRKERSQAEVIGPPAIVERIGVVCRLRSYCCVG